MLEKNTIWEVGEGELSKAVILEGGQELASVFKKPARLDDSLIEVIKLKEKDLFKKTFLTF